VGSAFEDVAFGMDQFSGAGKKGMDSKAPAETGTEPVKERNTD
jgi:hypothetical protein